MIPAKPVLTTFALCCALGTASASQDMRTAIIVVNDDSGVLSEPERAQPMKLHLLAQLKRPGGRFKYRDATIDIISTAYGRSVWVGKPADLKHEGRAKDLVEKVKTKANYCNDLGGAFAGLDQRLTSYRDTYSDVHLIFFSSLIDTPKPCADITIELPQMPPPIDVAALANAKLRSVLFLWVNPHQTRLWSDQLEPMRRWAQGHGVDFALLDIEQSVDFLRSDRAFERRITQ